MTFIREIIRASEINGRKADARKVIVEFTDETKTHCHCTFTEKVFARADGIILGAVLPQAPYSYWCHPDAQGARRASVKLFQDTVELNCNTCAKLQRMPFERDGSGLQPGKCEAIPANHPYHRGDYFLFAPEDCMGMECYVSR